MPTVSAVLRVFSITEEPEPLNPTEDTTLFDRNDKGHHLQQRL